MEWLEFDLPEELHNRIVKYIEDNPMRVYWDRNDRLNNSQIERIVSGGVLALSDFEMELIEHNIDFVSDMEHDLMDYVRATFYEELMEEFRKHYPSDEPDEHLEDEIAEYLDVNYREHTVLDINIKELLNNTGSITAAVVVHSNYDVATSDQEIDDLESYLGSVYQRVKHGVNEKDYLQEFIDSYTASLLIFPFKIDIMDFLSLKEEWEHADYIHIPKGTQFGFFSAFNGSGSVFEAETTNDMLLPKVEPNMSEYDSLDLIADVEHAYSMRDVYGDTRFIHESNIETVKKGE